MSKPALSDGPAFLTCKSFFVDLAAGVAFFGAMMMFLYLTQSNPTLLLDLGRAGHTSQVTGGEKLESGQKAKQKEDRE